MLEIFKAKTDAFKAADYEESGFTHEKNATTPEYARRSPSRHPPRTALTAHRSLRHPSQVRRGFRLLDEDKSGTLTRQEMRSVLMMFNLDIEARL